MSMQKTNSLTAGLMLGGLTLTGLFPLAAVAAEAPDYQPFTVGVEAGTLGLGGSLSWRFADHLGLTFGGNYFSYSRNGDEIEGVSYDTDLRLLSAPVGLQIFPWKDRSFHFTAGVLFNKNKLEGKIPDPGIPGSVDVDIGNNNYDVNADLGGVTLKVEQDDLCPYLSLGGNFYFDRAKHWSLGLEVGAVYAGSPNAAISIGNPATALNPTFQADKAEEERQIEDKAKDYKFYPIVKLSVNFSF